MIASFSSRARSLPRGGPSERQRVDFCGISACAAQPGGLDRVLQEHGHGERTDSARNGGDPAGDWRDVVIIHVSHEEAAIQIWFTSLPDMIVEGINLNDIRYAEEAPRS